MAKPRLEGYGLNSSMSLEDMRKQEQIRQLQQSREQVRARGTGQAPTTWGERAGILSNQVNEGVGWTSEAKFEQAEADLQSSIPNKYNAAQRQVSPGEQAGIDFRTAQGPMTGYGNNPAGQPPMPQYAQQAQAEQAKAQRPIAEMLAQMENESFPTPGAPQYSPPVKHPGTGSPLQVQQGSNPARGTMSITGVEDFSTPGDIKATAGPMQAGAAGVITPGQAPSLEGYGGMAGPTGLATPGNSIQEQGSLVTTTVPVQPPQRTHAEASAFDPAGYTAAPGATSTGPAGYPVKPPSNALTGLTGAAKSLSGYGQGYRPPPASSTASAPNSVWTGANTAALAQSYSPLPQSYVGGAPSGSFGGVGGGGGYGGGGGFQAPQFNAPQAPSFGGGAGGGSEPAGGGAGAPVAPQFTGQQPSASSSSSSSSSTKQTASSGGPELPADKLKAAQELADKEWQQGQDMIAAEKAAADKAAGTTTTASGTQPAGTTDSKAELDKIAADYQKAQDSATKANEDRYAQGMAGYGDRYTRNMATEAKRTDQDYADLDRDEKKALASNQQSLTNRGLGNSTIVDTTRRGITDQFAALRNRLGDQRISQKVAIDAGLSGDTLRFLEGRSDVAPDLQQLLALAQLIGQRPTVAS